MSDTGANASFADQIYAAASKIHLLETVILQVPASVRFFAMSKLA